MNNNVNKKNNDSRRLYNGNVMLCTGFDKAGGDATFRASTYMSGALLFRLSTGDFFVIDDGNDSFLIKYISLIPEEALVSNGASILKCKPCATGDLFVDEGSLKLYRETMPDKKKGTK